MTSILRAIRQWRERREPEGILCAQLQEWNESEPVIAPLALPAVRKLAAVKVDRVERFKLRLAR